MDKKRKQKLLWLIRKSLVLKEAEKDELFSKVDFMTDAQQKRLEKVLLQNEKAAEKVFKDLFSNDPDFFKRLQVFSQQHLKKLFKESLAITGRDAFKELVKSAKKLQT